MSQDLSSVATSPASTPLPLQSLGLPCWRHPGTGMDSGWVLAWCWLLFCAAHDLGLLRPGEPKTSTEQHCCCPPWPLCQHPPPLLRRRLPHPSSEPGFTSPTTKVWLEMSQCLCQLLALGEVWLVSSVVRPRTHNPQPVPVAPRI